MSSRLRLAVFLVASLAILQSVTAVLVYEVTRRQVVIGAAADRYAGDVQRAVAVLADLFRLRLCGLRLAGLPKPFARDIEGRL